MPSEESAPANEQGLVSSFTEMPITKALRQIRIANMIFGLVFLVVEILGIISNYDQLFILLFAIFFTILILLFEFQWKKLGIKLRKNFGFLYTHIGRAFYMFFVASMLLFVNNTLLKIAGIIYSVVALYNLLIVFIHPAFRNGNIKATDDPTASYTSGDAELKEMMKKNPQLAAKAFSGAMKMGMA